MLLALRTVCQPGKVSRSVKVGSGRDDLITNGSADSFEAAKAAALFEARALS
jgi:hypothetical protein